MSGQILISEEAVIEALTLSCEIDIIGTKTYRNKEGQYHRIHGPAVVYANGSKFWYKNDMFHREDGPAITWEDGSISYYINGKYLLKYEFILWQIKNGIKKKIKNGIASIKQYTK